MSARLFDSTSWGKKIGYSLMRRIAGLPFALTLSLCCLSPPHKRLHARSSPSASRSMPHRRHCPFTIRTARSPATGLHLDPGLLGMGASDVTCYWVPGTLGASAAGARIAMDARLLGWNDGVYAFHAGYWGATVGFYGRKSPAASATPGRRL